MCEVFLSLGFDDMKNATKSFGGGLRNRAGVHRSDNFIHGKIPDCIGCMTSDSNLKFNDDAQFA
jgi:hypothetical protein